MPTTSAARNREALLELLRCTRDPDQLAAAARHRHLAVRAAVAANTVTPPAALIRLATDRNTNVRELVAQHPATPPDVLAELARDSEMSVRTDALRHPNTPTAAVTRHSGSADNITRCLVAKHPNTDQGTLIELSYDSYAGVRAHVAGNPRTRPTDLTRLCNSANNGVRLAAVGNPAAPSEALRQILLRHAADELGPNAGRAAAVADVARTQLNQRAALTLTGAARDIALTLLPDWTGTDTALIATAEAVARDHRQRPAPHPSD